jgi:hypothetical protein
MLLCMLETVNLIWVKCDMSDVCARLIGHFDFSYVDRLQYFLVIALVCQLLINMIFSTATAL